jgi:Mannosylglycerate hydrolase MGH1-like glycoside hydrolase domain
VPVTQETAEHARLRDAREQDTPWRRWGPYLSERQWGTVREDYSPGGAAWDSFPHDHARSRAYRWGEDGIAGLSDDLQRLCFAIALWNGRDPILKERLFGLTNSEGNHGEDVKEYYFYLDSTPTHSYMKMLYKYPQAAFPYDDLVRTNGARSPLEPEYELLDTGVFEGSRYYDVVVEYAKASPEDLLIQIIVANRGPDAGALHLLPHLWFRNTWWKSPDAPRPRLGLLAGGAAPPAVVARHAALGERYLYCAGAGAVLFTENETNAERLSGQPNPTPHVKDGIAEYVVHGRREAVNPASQGTKCAAHYELAVPPGGSVTVRLRLTDRAPAALGDPFGAAFEDTLAARRREADEFYAALTPAGADADTARIFRQGLAGMLWSKQTFIFDVYDWVEGHGVDPLAGPAPGVRNSQWLHLAGEDIISMPDKWEYPWFAAWDLAFHTLALNVVDPDFAADQLGLMLDERYLHPNGQIPAYEWAFGDVNPPVHAWATLFSYRVSRHTVGPLARRRLEEMFQKLLLNFTWWVNRKDRTGRNVFEGGFLGLDNIGVFDRSAPLPTGGYLDQADGTAWMALFSQNMLEIALELALEDPKYEPLAVKFYEHFVWIAAAMDRVGEHRDEMWDEEDGFFYDVLRLPDGGSTRLKVRSLVGLLPLCAVTVYPAELLGRLPTFAARALNFQRRRAKVFATISRPGSGVKGRHMTSILDEPKLRRVLARLLDSTEFLSDYGIRSISRYHLDHPYVFRVGEQEWRVKYLPAESDGALFGGNSNWRGPIWIPVNALIVRALLQLYSFYGDGFRVECPTGSGRMLTLFEVARELVQRLGAIFRRDAQGRRPVFGAATMFQTDPHWRDHLLFYEYFHGDNGAGVGASHQTGWTGVIAALISFFVGHSAAEYLEDGAMGLVGPRG